MRGGAAISKGLAGISRGPAQVAGRELAGWLAHLAVSAAIKVTGGDQILRIPLGSCGLPRGERAERARLGVL